MAGGIDVKKDMHRCAGFPRAARVWVQAGRGWADRGQQLQMVALVGCAKVASCFLAPPLHTPVPALMTPRSTEWGAALPVAKPQPSTRQGPHTAAYNRHRMRPWLQQSAPARRGVSASLPSSRGQQRGPRPHSGMIPPHPHHPPSPGACVGVCTTRHLHEGTQVATALRRPSTLDAPNHSTTSKKERKQATAHGCWAAASPPLPPFQHLHLRLACPSPTQPSHRHDL